jgi:multidrug efflux pump subunit AcrB
VKGFNLSDWALSHRSLVWYFMIAATLAGVFSYLHLGREEDPDFTIKTMLIQAKWPGASVEDTVSQITDRIEKKLEELESLDYTKSMTTPGQTTIFVNLKDTTKARDVTPTWLRVRNMIGDIRGDFPQGIVGPVFNDRFGDVFGNVYAFTSDGLTPRQLRDYVENVRAQVLTVPNVGKVDLIGVRDEVIYLEFSTRQLAALGVDQQAIIRTLQSQNAITPSGVIQAGPERVALRVGGQFASEESLRAVNFRINDRFFRLSDVATVTRGYTDPPKSLFRFRGEPAIGLAIGMKTECRTCSQFGEALNDADEAGDRATCRSALMCIWCPISRWWWRRRSAASPRALFEAIAIVLGVSFVSLGMRPAWWSPCRSRWCWRSPSSTWPILGISLQRISLGALIIALGLLVDDAMIAVEMMVARLEVGDDLQEGCDLCLYPPPHSRC